MSRLIVDAVQDETQAQAGTMADALILVSVTDNEGNPVEGLKLENFTLRQGLHPDGGFPAIELKQAQENAVDESDGLYSLRVGPRGAENWHTGVYCIAIAAIGMMTDVGGVTPSRGQTVARIVIG